MLEPLAKVLHTTPAYLMGWGDEKPTVIINGELDDFTYAMHNEGKDLTDDEDGVIVEIPTSDQQWYFETLG